MNTTVGQPERATQNRGIALFRDELDCRNLVDRIGRDGSTNIEAEADRCTTSRHFVSRLYNGV